MAKTSYYNGTTKLVGVRPVDNKAFDLAGGIKSKHNSYDGYSRLAGYTSPDSTTWVPVDRKIYFKDHPSLHKCDARCQSATGHACECSCRGKFHGVGA